MLAKNARGKSGSPRSIRKLLCANSRARQADLEVAQNRPNQRRKLRLGDFHKEERQRAAAQTAVARGKMTFAEALQTYQERLSGDQSLKERSKAYRRERITALLKSWPDLNQLDVAQISKADGLAWAARFGKTASPSAFNNTIGTFRLVLDIAVEAGARYDNPAVHINGKKSG